MPTQAIPVRDVRASAAYRPMPISAVRGDVSPLSVKLKLATSMQRCRNSELTTIERWERIYLEEGPEGLSVERRGRSSTGRSKKLPKEVEEDLLAEVQRLRAENDYLKKLASLGFGRRATPAQKTQVVQKLRQRHSLDILLSIAQLPRSTFSKCFSFRRHCVPSENMVCWGKQQTKERLICV